jgi:hypothetical protein
MRGPEEWEGEQLSILPEGWGRKPLAVGVQVPGVDLAEHA